MNRYSRWAAFREAGLWLAAIPVLIPLYIVVVTALKPAAEGSGHYFKPPAHPTLHNLSQAWSEAGSGTVSFAGALFNSAFTTTAVVVLVIVIAAPAGYAIARRGSKLAGALFGMFALGIILPVQLGVIPLYAFMVEAELAGTRTGLILVYLGMLLPLAIFLYTGFFRSLPTAYEEAARVDGASSVRIFVQVVFPLVRPITGVVAILSGLIVWNDFFVSLVFVGGTSNETLPVAVYSFVGRFSVQWPLVFASALIAMLPVLVFYGFMQRTVMRGFASTLRG